MAHACAHHAAHTTSIPVNNEAQVPTAKRNSSSVFSFALNEVGLKPLPTRPYLHPQLGAQTAARGYLAVQAPVMSHERHMVHENRMPLLLLCTSASSAWHCPLPRDQGAGEGGQRSLLVALHLQQLRKRALLDSHSDLDTAIIVALSRTTLAGACTTPAPPAPLAPPPPPLRPPPSPSPRHHRRQHCHSHHRRQE